MLTELSPRKKYSRIKQSIFEGFIVFVWVLPLAYIIRSYAIDQRELSIELADRLDRLTQSLERIELMVDGPADLETILTLPSARPYNRNSVSFDEPTKGVVR